MESSRWDKDPPGERRPQQSQHWRSWGVGGAGEATRGGLFPVPFPSGDSWPEVTQHRMRFQGQGPWSPGLWTTPAHSHCKPQTGAVDNASPRQPHAPDQHEKNTGRQHLHLWSLACPPWLHSIPHIKGTILSEALSGFLVSDRRTKTVAGLRWLWLRKEATPTASRTTLSSSLAPRGRGVNTLGRGGCTLMVLSSDLFD
uniref:DIP2C antisense RNA 1 n=2 Tax=Pan TaxID=9596 RepID=H2REE4_PANTR|nr:uncharacterized protein LOC100609481 isoform X4 [Pan troglodytes]